MTRVREPVPIGAGMNELSLSRWLIVVVALSFSGPLPTDLFPRPVAALAMFPESPINARLVAACLVSRSTILRRRRRTGTFVPRDIPSVGRPHISYAAPESRFARSGRNAARSSAANSSGSSHVAK